jgi:hypothetical protein
MEFLDRVIPAQAKAIREKMFGHDPSPIAHHLSPLKLLDGQEGTELSQFGIIDHLRISGEQYR